MTHTYTAQSICSDDVPNRDAMRVCVRMCARLYTCLIYQMHLQLICLWYRVFLRASSSILRFYVINLGQSTD